MPLYPVDWLKEFIDLGKKPLTGKNVLESLARIGLEEDGLIEKNIKGPVVVGQVKEFTSEKQKNGKVINWCQVDVGNKINGIICGANNFVKNDFVVVALPGSVLVNNFEITARKTYGHISDGMICSFSELGIPIESDGIIVLNSYPDLKNYKVGDNAIDLLDLNSDVVELNITPDRGYCFSIRGVARELSTTLAKKYSDPINFHRTNNSPTINKFPIEITKGCDSFVAVSIENCLASKESPYFIQKRVAESGMRPINLAVDVANYVMLEFGQPLHTYDKDTLHSPIIVRKAKKKEKIKTLDGSVRDLEEDDLLITDKAKILGIAGVMGGFETEITEKTKNILIESAHFDSSIIAKSAKAHKIPSESSKRYERGVDFNIQEAAALRTAELLITYGGGKITDISKKENRKKQNTINFDFSLTEKITGVKIDKSKQIEILNLLGCSVKNNLVTVPSWRPDFKIPEDLVEDIIRIYGYDKVESNTDFARFNFQKSDDLFFKKMLVHRALAGRGFYGVLSYPWIEKDILDKMLIKSDDERQNLIELENPLDVNAPYLRTSILQTLHKTMLVNFSRGIEKTQKDFGIFELSNISFSDKNDNLDISTWKNSSAYLRTIVSSVPNQDLYVAGIIINSSMESIISISNDIFNVFNAEYRTNQAEKMPWHTGKCIEYKIGHISVGNAGLLHPKVCENLGLPKESYAFELNLSEIFNNSEKIDANEISTWPVAKTDLAFIVEKNVPVGDIVDVLLAERWSENVEVFDIFEGENVPDGKKSVALTVYLRDDEKTLSNHDIREARESMIKVIEQKFGGYLRDF